MQRREFLIAAASTVAIAAAPLFADEPQSPRQYFELRTYHFSTPEKQAAYEQFLAQTAIPAYNRAGVTPVGAFKPADPSKPGGTDLYLLLPHPSLESFAKLESTLAADAAFQQAGAPILNAPKSNPAYTRYESMLLLAMEGAPQVKTPPKSDTRLFELRTYESPNEERARNKLAMFNKGEFAIFGRANMPGVFFGGAIAGPQLPQLTYMICHPSPDDVKKDWANFFADPDWKKLIADPSYKDNVSKVISRFLKPAAGSQI